MDKDYRAEAEKAVESKLNPSGDKMVEAIKRDFAQAIEILLQLRDEASDGEVKRMLSIAITEAQTAQMWAVKAITWGN